MENKDELTKTGGVIVLFSDLLIQCDKRNIRYFTIDTNKAHYSNKLIALLSIWFMLFIKIRHSTHVSLHGTANDYMFIAPIAVLLAKLFGKTVSLRKFAGNFDEIYDTMHILLKSIVSWTLRESDANFFETKYLVKHFSPLNTHTYWFPNVREKPDTKREGEFQKRFIFLGKVTQEKGILELLEASNQLDDSYTIDMYGYKGDDLLNFNFESYKAKYKRALASTEVLKTLQEYDVLILPSYIEGYPGVIIEALSVGLPIIATNLEGIQEMIDSQSSVLIEPKNIAQLKQAIESFTNTNYTERSAAALKQFDQFETNHQTDKFFRHIGFDTPIFHKKDTNSAIDY
jgi:glycosyltransferase involved in cell wall biosynthesis